MLSDRVKRLEMAGKLHCVKNKGRTDKFCSLAVSVGSHSFDVFLRRVSALLKN